MATQKGRNWSSGDIVTAANLSSIERGVSAVTEEYTPTTWANGNTVTAAALNNIEQGIANAGDGSSDFSTATVTLINGTSSNRCVLIPRTSEAFLPFEPYSFVSCFVSLLPSGTTEVTAVLYKGSCKIKEGASGDQLNAVPVATTFAVTSGSAELVTGGVIITGDCTITISDVPK